MRRIAFAAALLVSTASTCLAQSGQPQLATSMFPTASNVVLPTALDNFGLGTGNNVAFRTLTATSPGVNNTISAVAATGATAVSANFGASSGFADLQTASSGANNQAAGFYIGGVFSSQAASGDNGAGKTTLSVTGHLNDATVTVASATGIRSGDAVFIAMDDGSLFSTAVSGAPTGSVVTISPVLPGTATSGNAFYDYAGHIQGGISAGVTTSAATNIFGVEGWEFNLSARAGSNLFFKCVACAAANSDDAVSAEGPWDMVYGASRQNGSIGSVVGLAFGPWSGAQPLKTTGTIIKTFGTGTVADGIDLSSYTITGNAWKSTGATINGAGAFDGTNLMISGSDGIKGLVGGTTAALRMTGGAGFAALEGTDPTGVGSFQPLKVGGSTTSLQVGGADALTIDASKNITSVGNLITPKLTGYAVGSLPSGTIGMLAYVIDQITACPVPGVSPTAGGAFKCPVFYNGSAWVGM